MIKIQQWSWITKENCEPFLAILREVYKQVYNICLNKIAELIKVLKFLTFVSANMIFATLFLDRDASLVV